MPELPDISAYITALEERIVGQTLERVRLGSVFLLRTVEPPIECRGRAEWCANCGASGSGSRSGSTAKLWLVLHLMIAGRLHWKASAGEAGGQKCAGGV